MDLETRPPRLRLLLLASGDFAFNLYWQSIMLFLLFCYTDAMGLPVAVAATIFMLASVWDGFANFAAGIIVDRRGTTRGYRSWLMLGSLPLAVSFVLTYLPPPFGTGFLGVTILFTAHLLFRTAYAMVNVPYLAMTARISADSGDRAFVAGMRMLFGTMAAVTVALGTLPLGRWLAGDAAPADLYFGAAMLFALLGTAILLLVGGSYSETGVELPETPVSIRDSLRSLAGNRAFVTLNLAMMAMIVAITVLNKSVLYYFKYFHGDDSAGQLALASMSLISVVAIPLWMLLARPVGMRVLWFLAAGICIGGLSFFAVAGIHRPEAMQLFLVGMQAAIVGLNFVFWAMLPDTIEYGEQATGLRVEGAMFGLAALLQRVAIGVATAILGLGFGAAGYVANVEQSAETLAGMRWTIALVPLAFLLLSCLFMALNPLGAARGRRPIRRERG